MNMIGTIIELLSLDDFKGVSHNIDIAKGKYEIKDTWEKGIKQIKRNKAWLKK